MQAERTTHVVEDTNYHFKSFSPYTFVGERPSGGPPPLIPSRIAEQLLKKKRQKSLPPLQYRTRSDLSVYSCSTVDNTFGNLPSHRPEAYNPDTSIQDEKIDRSTHFLSRIHAIKYFNRTDTAHDEMTIRIDKKSDNVRQKTKHQVSVKAPVNGRKNVKVDHFANNGQETEQGSLDIEKINELSIVFEKHERMQSKNNNFKNNDINMKNDLKYDNTSDQLDVNNAPEINDNVTRRDSYKEKMAKETPQNVKIDHLNMCDSETPKKKTKRRGIMGRMRKRGYIYDPKPIISKSTKPNDKLNAILAEATYTDYWAKRRRNNEAAKKSREDRRKKELELIKTANDLKIERDKLRARVKELESWISKHISK